MKLNKRPDSNDGEALNEKSFIESLGEMGFVNLELAGIFFVKAFNEIQKGSKSYKKLEKEIFKYNRSFIKNSKLNKVDFEVKQLHNIRNLEVFYEPVVRYFGTAKILLICCVETYINQVAHVLLSGRKLDEFDKLSIIGKWLFIQDLLKLKKRLEIDKNPLQGLIKLVSERNRLVHYKNRIKSLQNLEVPNYIDDLALNPKSCLDNLKAVQMLLHKFNNYWTGSSGPGWLDIDDVESNYRSPCFYLGNRKVGIVLYSDKYDKELD